MSTLAKRLIALTLFTALAVMPTCVLRAQDWQYTNGPFADSTNSKKVSDVIAFSKPYESRLFAASRSNGVFRTDDRGDHWQQCWLIPKDTVNTIVAHGSIVLIGTYKGLVRSVDSGNHFDSVQNVYYRPYISQIVCDKNNVFYAIAGFSASNNVGCFRSNDSGLTWTYLTSLPVSLRPEALEVDSSNQILFIGYPPPNDPQFISIEIWKSGDNGNTWTQTQAPYYLENAFMFGAAPNGDFYAFTKDLGLLRANDSEYDLWGQITFPRWQFEYIHHFAFLTADSFCVTTADSICFTNDRATTWKSIAAPLANFASCEYASKGDLFAASSNGVIRVGFSRSSVAPSSAFQDSSEFYYASGNLCLKLAKPSNVQIELFDEAGRQITSFPERVAGIGEITFPVPSALMPGIFFACCNSPAGFQTCKFMIGP